MPGTGWQATQLLALQHSKRLQLARGPIADGRQLSLLLLMQQDNLGAPPAPVVLGSALAVHVGIPNLGK